MFKKKEKTIAEMFEEGFDNIIKNAEAYGKQYGFNSVPIKVLKEYKNVYCKNLKKAMENELKTKP